MLNLESEEKLYDAKHALDTATTENVIELCKEYLAALAQYRSELYELAGTPRINLQTKSSPESRDVDSARKAVRVAIEDTTQERNRIEALLLSFTVVSGYGAVETLNRRKHKNSDQWEVKAGGVRANDSVADSKMTIQEAVDTASVLRRKEYLDRNANFESEEATV